MIDSLRQGKVYFLRQKAHVTFMFRVVLYQSPRQDAHTVRVSEVHHGDANRFLA